jgi:hypothetical protein
MDELDAEIEECSMMLNYQQELENDPSRNKVGLLNRNANKVPVFSQFNNVPGKALSQKGCSPQFKKA